MMNIFSNRHSTYEMLLTEHIDGVISAADDAKLTQHLSTCADCAVDLREQSQIRTLLRAEPLVAAPRSFALPYAPRTVDTSEPSGITKLMRSMQMATAAAAMVLVALVGLSVMQTSPAAVTQTSIADAAGSTAESSTAPDESLSFAGAAATGQDAPPAIESAPPAETQLMFERAPAASVDTSVPEQGDGTALVPTEDAQKTLASPPLLPDDFVPQPGLAGDTAPTADNHRTALDWALLAASLATALLALAVVAVTWRARRPA